MEKKQMIMIGGGAAVALAVGVGAFLFLGGDEEEAPLPDQDIVAPAPTPTPDTTVSTDVTDGTTTEGGEGAVEGEVLPEEGGLAPDMSGTVDLTGGGSSGGSSVDVDTGIPPVLTDVSGSLSAKVIQVYPQLIVSSNVTGQLLCVQTSGDYTSLAPGSSISIEYNVVGTTTYPQEISASSITPMGSGTDMVGAYVIMATKAMGGSADTLSQYRYIGLDITDVRNLSAGEIDAFLWKITSLAGNGSVVFFHTQESLTEDGYIKNGVFENGVLLKFSSEGQTGEGDFNYTASRWSSDTNYATMAGRAETDLSGGFTITS